MAQKKLTDAFPEAQVLAMANEEGNPMRVAELMEFARNERHIPRGESRVWIERAIDKALAAKMEFVSTFNCLYQFLCRYVKVMCPYCNEDMAVVNGGAGGNSHHTTYRCGGCKAEVCLGMPSNGFGVTPPPDPKT